jgi:hypothetical protein
MTNDEKELVEMMAIKWHGLTLWNKLSDNEKSQGRAKMFRLIEMVKANIGKIAAVCECVWDDYHDEYKEVTKFCKVCHGTGVVARTEKP